MGERGTGEQLVREGRKRGRGGEQRPAAELGRGGVGAAVMRGVGAAKQREREVRKSRRGEDKAERGKWVSTGFSFIF
jgi:hypothetical protein